MTMDAKKRLNVFRELGPCSYPKSTVHYACIIKKFHVPKSWLERLSMLKMLSGSSCDCCCHGDAGAAGLSLLLAADITVAGSESTGFGLISLSLAEAGACCIADVMSVLSDGCNTHTHTHIQQRRENGSAPPLLIFR